MSTRRSSGFNLKLSKNNKYFAKHDRQLRSLCTLTQRLNVAKSSLHIVLYTGRAPLLFFRTRELKKN